MDDYDIFTDLGKCDKPTPGFKKISDYFVYNARHDGRLKSRYTANDHETGIPLKSSHLNGSPDGHTLGRVQWIIPVSH